MFRSSEFKACLSFGSGLGGCEENDNLLGEGLSFGGRFLSSYYEEV